MTNFVLDPNTDIVASVPRSTKQYVRRQYRDKQFMGGEQEWSKKLEISSTVYVGNLSCYTNEYQIYELFSRCGSIKRIIMGLDRFKKMPCGFCFVEYDERSSALKSIKYLSKTHLDGRDIQVDIDGGFQEGRQFGRGQSGGQIGDERRRERESTGGYANRGGANQGSGAMLTRSITIVACITLISLMLTVQSTESAELSAASDLRFMPFGSLLGGGGLYNPMMLNPYANRYDGKAARFVSVKRVKEAQVSKQRKQFEVDLAQFLVNLMKSAKPTLMKAFIKATLADKQLKETAIGLFFGSGDEGSEESEETDKDKEKEKDDKAKDEKAKDEEKEETPKKDKAGVVEKEEKEKKKRASSEEK